MLCALSVGDGEFSSPPLSGTLVTANLPPVSVLLVPETTRSVVWDDPRPLWTLM